jgi:hypothetical protein
MHWISEREDNLLLSGEVVRCLSRTSKNGKDAARIQ